jgi:hypothetical protein
MIVIRIESAKLKEMKNLFKVHPLPAKNAYRIPVRAMVAPYMPAVDPIRIHCHKLPSDLSQLSKQVSVQE